MGRYLVLLFIAVPILEIAVFIQAGELIGLWPTLAGIVVTAVVGVSLLRWQGAGTLRRAQASLDKGQIPVSSLAEGVALIAAGALLLTPGFITDGVGFLLLIPAVRRRIGAYLIKQIAVIAPGYPGPASGQTGNPAGAGDEVRDDVRDDADGGVIEAEYEDLSDTKPGPDSPWKDRSGR